MVKEVFQNAGTPIDDAALEFALETAQDSRFQQLVNCPEQVGRVAIAAGCLYAASKRIGATEEQWTNFLQQLRTQLTHRLRAKFRMEMNDVLKGLPRTPGTGRNEILDSPRKRKDACDLVSRYERRGDSKRLAYEKAGRDMNCSARTIQRAWKGRASGVPKPKKSRTV